MRASIQHPVPVRWSPGRGRQSKLAFRAERSEVEIPEAPGLAGAPRFETGPLYGRTTLARTYLVHDGGFWVPVQGRHLDGEPFSTGAPAPLARALGFLSGRRDGAANGLARVGTPLCGRTSVAGARPFDHGSDLPASAPPPAPDHAEMARAALSRHASRNLAVDGDALFMRVCPPVILMPGGKPEAAVELPWTVSGGPAFLPERRADAYRFAASMGVRDGEEAVRRAYLQMPEGLDPAYYGEMELDDFVNAAPVVLEHVAARVAKRLSLVGGDLPGEVASALSRLRPLGDLARIGAVPPECRGDLVDLALAAARALRKACPERYEPEYLKGVEVYHEHFARPRLAACGASIPDEDLDGIGALAP